MAIESSGTAAVVGTYVTEQGPLPGRTASSVWIEAAMGALKDAGLTPGDVDGLVGSGPGNNALWNPHGIYVDLFGTPLRFYADVKVGASSPGAAIAVAASAIREGRASVVLVCNGAGEPDMKPQGGGGGLSRDEAVARMSMLGSEFEYPWGTTRIADYAMMAQRHMYEYGTTSEQLAEVAVAARYHATMTPESVMGVRGELTIDDVVNSRMIASPLHLLDCCLINNGGGAYVVTSGERARDMPHPPVYLLGDGENYPFNDRHYTRSMTGFDESGSAAQALRQAKLTHDDIDLAGISDHFTINVIMELEDAGFCKKGEGGSFVEGGALKVGGRLPTNTDGGYLAHSHAGACGVFTMIEAVHQLRHEAGDRQVQDANFALLRGTGGAMQASYTAILGRNIP
jgi:acetyl-CoA acetyltransferase